jgi:hypothetical protein
MASIAGRPDGCDDLRMAHVQSPIINQIVPDPVERYLAGLNHRGSRSLEIARRRRAGPAARRCGGRRTASHAGGGDRRDTHIIGAAIGYSGIWLAGALPADGLLLTMELDPERARTAARTSRGRALPTAPKSRRGCAADAREVSDPST